MIDDEPVLDGRDRYDLRELQRRLAATYVDDWDPETADAGTAIMEVFADMAADVIERVDRLPEKHRLSFVDALEVDPLPPTPARTPVTFEVDDTAGHNVAIPPNTELQAPETETRPLQRFETSNDQPLEATPATMTDVISADPAVDRFVTHATDESVQLFVGENEQEHALYLGSKDVLQLAPGSQIELEFQTNAPISLIRDVLVWEYYGTDESEEDGWQPLTLPNRQPFPASAWSLFQQTEIWLEQLTAPINDHGYEPAADEWDVTAVRSLIEDVSHDRFGFDDRTVGPLLPAALFEDTNSVDQSTVEMVLPHLETLAAHLQRTLRQNRFGNDLETHSLTLEIPGQLTEHDLAGTTSRWLRCRIPDQEFAPVLFDLLVENIQIRLNPDGQSAPLDVIAGDTGSATTQGTRVIGAASSMDEDLFVFAADEAFSKPGANVTLQFEVDELPEYLEDREDGPDELLWEYYDGERWHSLEVEDRTDHLTRSGTVSFEVPTGMEPGHAYGGDEHYWIRATALGTAMETPEMPDPLEGAGELDLSDELDAGRYAEEIEENMQEQITSYEEYFEQTDAEPAPGYEPEDYDEMMETHLETAGYDKEEYEEIIQESIDESLEQLDDWQKQATEPTDEQDEQGDDMSGWFEDVTDAIMNRHPEILAVDLEYTLAPTPVETVLTYNNHTTRTITDDEQFRPFEPVPGERQAVYLGFDRPVRDGPIPLYLDLTAGSLPLWFDHQITVECCTDPLGEEWRRVEFDDETDGLSRHGVLTLSVPEPTEAIELFGRQRHWLRIRLIDDEFARQSCLFRRHMDADTETNRFELHDRAEVERKRRRRTHAPPHLEGVYPNTCWAVNVESVETERLGRSDGTPNQTLQFDRTPALETEIWVDERESLSETAREDLKAVHPDRTIEERDEEGELTHFWVRWERVESFLESAGSDRHYMLSEVNGQVTFGDGQTGKIPPTGAVTASYATGGGTEGNVEAGAITDLAENLPSISAVSNPLPGMGGEDAEPTEELAARTHQKLRDRGRAVTTDGIERIAHSASREVARVRCTAGNDGLGMPGQVTVVVVPNRTTATPTPSETLLERVRETLEEHAPATMVDAKECLAVRGPQYVEVSIDATIRTDPSHNSSTIQKRARRTLETFLHPLSGGFDGCGWEIGYAPSPSVFAAALERVEGVRGVTGLTATFADGSGQLTLSGATAPPTIAADSLLCSGTHSVRSEFGGER